MGVVLGLIMIVLGLLAASSAIASFSQDAGAIIDKLRPVQGITGVIGALAGIIFLISNAVSIGGAMKSTGLATLIPSIGGPLVLATTGFLMGFSMISSMLAGNAEARDKADELYRTLTPFQVPLGAVSVILGVWAILA